MTKTQIRDIITKIHFYLLGFALLNFALKSTIEISLNYRFSYFITLLVYASGIILFLWNLKPFKKIGIYFSFYAFTPILTLLFWLFGGIFFGILASIVLYPIQPNYIELEKNDFVIYQKAQGFLGSCCPYEITEKQFFVLEKRMKEVNLNNEIEFSDNSIYTSNGKTELKIRFEKYQFLENNLRERDTIILIKTE
ncbi:hypothetical protein [Lacinutrix sp. Bg11-31]|uniref:hypothetical protein n=1 Tax=Lacinutrix sp. Bg11-31 TaxID=2057808 RepID=UPI000C319EEB|nr:hypothetical protein [Lacinutrix sp. Bg11-31]AUC80660.1 hypothetical protein CW733_00310 [Lacinutrix sp. Bg11-31]